MREVRVVRFDWAAMAASMLVIMACAVTAYASAEYGRRIGQLELGQADGAQEEARREPFFLDAIDMTPNGAKEPMYQVRWLDEYSQIRQVWVTGELSRDRLIAWIQGGAR